MRVGRKVRTKYGIHTIQCVTYIRSESIDMNEI